MVASENKAASKATRAPNDTPSQTVLSILHLSPINQSPKLPTNIADIDVKESQIVNSMGKT